MYIPRPFAIDDGAAWAFVRERGFGVVVARGDQGLTAAHVPLLVLETPEPRIEFHVARANPLHEILAVQSEVLIIVSGPDGYISPDWYLSDNQVPTWNYISVHLGGRARALPPDATLAHVEALSHQFETRIGGKKPWTLDKVSPARRDAMLKAIVGISVGIETIEAQWKLGQHKAPMDQANVIKMLDWRGDWQSLALAEATKRRLLQTQADTPEPIKESA